MVISSVYFLYYELKNWNFKKILFFTLGLIIGLIIMISKPLTENEGIVFVFFCGLVSVCGMTLPGLSGSFLLLLLGNYTLLLVDSVNAIYFSISDIIRLDFDFISDPYRTKLLKLAAIFTLGSITGLIFFSNVLSFVLRKYHQNTIATIIGFIGGSLGVIWPWRKKVYKNDELGEIVFNSIGKPEIAYYEYVLPNIKSTDFWLLSLFIILGVIFVSLLERYGIKKRG